MTPVASAAPQNVNSNSLLGMVPDVVSHVLVPFLEWSDRASAARTCRFLRDRVTRAPSLPHVTLSSRHESPPNDKVRSLKFFGSFLDGSNMGLILSKYPNLTSIDLGECNYMEPSAVRALTARLKGELPGLPDRLKLVKLVLPRGIGATSEGEIWQLLQNLDWSVLEYLDCSDTGFVLDEDKLNWLAEHGIFQNAPHLRELRLASDGLPRLLDMQPRSVTTLFANYGTEWAAPTLIERLETNRFSGIHWLGRLQTQRPAIRNLLDAVHPRLAHFRVIHLNLIGDGVDERILQISQQLRLNQVLEEVTLDFDTETEGVTIGLLDALRSPQLKTVCIDNRKISERSVPFLLRYLQFRPSVLFLFRGETGDLRSRKKAIEMVRFIYRTRSLYRAPEIQRDLSALFAFLPGDEIEAGGAPSERGQS
jgi:hypothetical protein